MKIAERLGATDKTPDAPGPCSHAAGPLVVLAHGYCNAFLMLWMMPLCCLFSSFPDGLQHHCCSNAGFIFLGTLLRLAALQGRHHPAVGAASADSSASGAAAASQRVSRGSGDSDLGLKTSSAAAVPGIGRMDGIVLDSAPAPITPDIAARYCLHRCQASGLTSR